MSHKKKLVLKDNIQEHYACRTSDNCIKLDALLELLGGIHDWHACTLYNDALPIFEKFSELSNNLKGGKPGYLKVETLHVEDYADEVKRFKIHVFVQPQTHDDRRRLWFHRGLLMKFPQSIGFCRVFCFPNKLFCILLLHTFLNPT